MHSNKEIKVCKKCLLPESFPNADIDQNNVCSYCREYKPVNPRGKKELIKKLTGRRGKIYDVVVPISGGKDSTYILWYAKKVLRLRVIAVNYDSGLQAELSKENMRKACDSLGVPLVVKTVNYKRQTALLRTILHVAEAANSFFHTCGNCENGIRSSAVRVALQYNIPFVLYGDDPLDLPMGIGGNRAFLSKIMKNKKAIPKVVCHMLHYSLLSILQQREMGIPLKQCIFHPLATAPWPKNRVEVVHFYQFIPWDPLKSINIIKEEVGWKPAENKDSRFDCKIHCFGDHHWIQEFGISNNGFLRSVMLRRGNIGKAKALADEEYIRGHVNEDCMQVTRELGLKNYRMPA